MSSQLPGQHYSPDGRFWWDGTAWRPVAAASPAPAPGQPGATPGGQPAAPWQQPPVSGQQPSVPGQPAPPYVAGPPGPGVPPPGGTPPARSARPGFLPALIGTLVAAALLGGIIGWTVGTTTTEPPGSDTPPELAAEFPSGDRQYLPGVTLDLVVDDWLKKANSWQCTDEPADPDNYLGVKRVTECSPDEDRDMLVRIEYDAEDKIKLVESTCRLGLKTTACTTLAAALAHTVLSPQGNKLRDQAEKWARENVDSERATVIGGVRLQANLQPQHEMTATPAA